MESIERLLLEEPTNLYIALGVAELALLAVWHSRRSRGLAMALAAPPLLALAVLLADVLVKTDREQIAQALQAVARTGERGEVDAARPYLADDMRLVRGSISADRDAALEIARAALAFWPVKRVKLQRLETTVEGDRAASDVEAQLTSRREETLPTAWRVQWVRTRDGWKILQVELVRPAWAAGGGLLPF